MKHCADRRTAFSRCGHWPVWLVLGLLLSACGPPQSAEEQIRAGLDQLETAAQERDAGVLLDWISDDYYDSQGRDKKALRAIVRIHLLRNHHLYLHKIIKQIDVAESRATVTVLVAAAGEPIDGVDSLVNLQAELLRFDLELTQDGDEWRLSAAKWRRIPAHHFLL